MAHGKETPRQKMIGMMYLVLTALLALNVAAEVLNAFSLIDDSLRKTTEITVGKNEDIYSKFEAAMKENPVKTGPWHKKAVQIKEKATELVDYIQSLKVKVVKTAEGEEGGDPNNIIKKDDINVPSQIMILEKNGGKTNSEILQGKIKEFRDLLIGIVGKTKATEGVIDGLNKTLNTDDIKGKEGNVVPWAVANFEHMPLAGVVALMSKMQADVRNAESTVLSFLYQGIDAASFKFNKIEAIVTAPTNYVLKGQPFKAHVFIAASDSTVTPVIKMNGGKELPVEKGKGIFTGSTGSAGIKSFGGVIELKNPKTKQVMEFPFKSEYTVGEASLVVSPTKMNVFYIGVDNPVDISVPGVPPNKVSPTFSGKGSIKRKGKGYIVNVKGNQREVKVGATAELDGQRRNMGSKVFRVRKVPSPVAKVGGKLGGTVAKSWLSAQSGVAAVLDNFEFDLKFRVTSFTVSTTDRSGYVKEKKASGARFTGPQKQIIGMARSKGRLLITDIQARGPDGSTRNLGSIAFKIK